MMSAQHSAGPWGINGKTHTGWRIDALGENRVVGLDFLAHPVAFVSHLTDAHLIAAAPDLLAALKGLMALYHLRTDGTGALLTTDAWEAAELAIHDAETGP